LSKELTTTEKKNYLEVALNALLQNDEHWIVDKALTVVTWSLTGFDLS